MVVHDGQQAESGHYVSLVKWKKQWIKMDDKDLVTKVVRIDILGIKEWLEKNCCLLFYKKVEEESKTELVEVDEKVTESVQEVPETGDFENKVESHENHDDENKESQKEIPQNKESDELAILTDNYWYLTSNGLVNEKPSKGVMATLLEGNQEQGKWKEIWIAVKKKNSEEKNKLKIWVNRKEARMTMDPKSNKTDIGVMLKSTSAVNNRIKKACGEELEWLRSESTSGLPLFEKGSNDGPVQESKSDL
jgi:hypothetical protein